VTGTLGEGKPERLGVGELLAAEWDPSEGEPGGDEDTEPDAEGSLEPEVATPLPEPQPDADTPRASATSRQAPMRRCLMMPPGGMTGWTGCWTRWQSDGFPPMQACQPSL
jgi:hypothetical protein